MKTVKYHGKEIPVSRILQIIEKAFQDHLDKLDFRVKPYVFNPGCAPIDLNYRLTNEEVHAVLKMPKVGKRVCYGEACRLQNEECYDSQGELVSFEPAMRLITTWAQERGYYVEFDEDELEVVEPVSGFT